MPLDEKRLKSADLEKDISLWVTLVSAGAVKRRCKVGVLSMQWHALPHSLEKNVTRWLLQEWPGIEAGSVCSHSLLQPVHSHSFGSWLFALPGWLLCCGQCQPLEGLRMPAPCHKPGGSPLGGAPLMGNAWLFPAKSREKPCRRSQVEGI